MKLFLYSFFFFAVAAQAQMQVLQTNEEGKEVHLALDKSKDYQVGDVINFYKNGKNVSRGKIVLLSPKKTKAAVKLTHGAKFNSELVAYSSSQAPVPERKVAQVKKVVPKEVERKPASISNIRSSIRPTLSNTTTSDLLYFPEEKSFLLNVEAGYAQSNIDLDGLSQIKQTQTVLRPTLNYSPFEKFSFGLGLGYASQTVSSGGASDSGSGIEDPTLNFAYQFMSYSADKLQLVFLLEISPSIGDSEDNNVLRGNHLIRTGALFGMKHGAFSWNVVPNLGYHTETETEGGLNNMEPYFVFAIDGELQYDFNQQWAVYAPLLLSYTGEQKASDDSYTLKSYMSLGLGAGFKFAVSNDLNIYFDTRYRMAPSVKAETALSSHDGDESGFQVTVGTNFKF